MRNIITICLLIAVVGFSCRRSPSKPDIPWHQQRVLILGNSITQNGLYVSALEYALRKKHPEGKFDIISIGLGSETVSGLTEHNHPFPRPNLAERLDRALEKVKPDLVLACYGMNDGIYHPISEGRMKAFQDGITHLAKAVKKTNAPLTIITPPPFDSLPILDKLADEDATDFGWSTPYSGYDLTLGTFSDWLAGSEGVDFEVIDLHYYFKAAIEKQRQKDSLFTYANDGIHPSPEGHLLMAQIIAGGLGLEVDDILGLSPNELFNDPFFKLVDERRRTTSEGWLPYVGYTRGRVVASNSLKEMEEKLAVIDERIGEYMIRE